MKRLLASLIAVVSVLFVVVASSHDLSWNFICRESGDVVGRMHFSPSDNQRGTFRVEYRGESISGRYQMARPVQPGESVPIVYYASDGRQTRGEHVWALDGSRYVSFDGICFDACPK